MDICFGGIGINGHLAFNEADGSLTCEEFKALKTRCCPFPETRAANAIGDFGGRLEDMPRWCVTIGFNEIYNARKIRLPDWHWAVARRCGYGEMTANSLSAWWQSIRCSDPHDRVYKSGGLTHSKDLSGKGPGLYWPPF